MALTDQQRAELKALAKKPCTPGLIIALGNFAREAIPALLADLEEAERRKKQLEGALIAEQEHVAQLEADLEASDAALIESRANDREAMRQGEILGLTWDTVDMSRRVARLPKTKNGSARDVPLSTRAMQLLELMRGRGDDRIFTVSSASADALFRRGKARAMIDGLHFHDTRREATSRLSKKVDVLTLARITGHKDIRMLMIYYQTDMADVAQQIG